MIPKIRPTSQTKPIRPNFLIIGLPKAGTTTLHYILADHPDVCLPRNKEAHFFNNPDEYAKGADYYASRHFPHHSRERFIGDITPNYFVASDSFARIRDMLGDQVKLVVCYRFPIMRSFSHYIHSLRIRECSGNFDDTLNDTGAHRNIHQASLYAERTRQLFDIFPRQNILPLIFERDIADQGSQIAYKKIADFLGLKSTHGFKAERHENLNQLPFISIATTKGKCRTIYGTHRYNPYDLIIEWKQENKYYDLIIIPHSEWRRKAHRKTIHWAFDYVANRTLQLKRSDMAHYHEKLFANDVEELRELLDDPIPEWDIDRLPEPAYASIKGAIPLSIPLESLSSFKRALFRDLGPDINRFLP